MGMDDRAPSGCSRSTPPAFVERGSSTSAPTRGCTVVAGAPLRPSLSARVRRVLRHAGRVVAGAPLRPSLSVRVVVGDGDAAEPRCSRSTPPAFVERAGAELRRAPARRSCSRSTPPAFVERWTPSRRWSASSSCSRSTPPAFVERRSATPIGPTIAKVVAGAPLRPSLSVGPRRGDGRLHQVVAGAPLRPSLSGTVALRTRAPADRCSRSTPPAFVERSSTAGHGGCRWTVVAGAPLRPSLSGLRTGPSPTRSVSGCSRSTPPAFVERATSSTRRGSRCRVVAGAPLRPSLSGGKRRVRWRVLA